MNSAVMILTGAGQIGMAIARRMGYGMKKMLKNEKISHICIGSDGIDGRKGQTTPFDGIPDMDRQPVRLSLQSVEHVGNDTLWIRYKTTSK